MNQPTAIKDHPILFTGEMVQAILDGRKTQTRRVVNPQPIEFCDEDGSTVISSGHSFKSGGSWWLCKRCPYGSPGDRLNVREACWIWGKWHRNGLTPTGRPAWRFKAVGKRVEYTKPDKTAKRNSDTGWVYRHARYMPRWACRLWLEPVSIRVERVQEISEDDAVAEGVDAVSVADVPRQATWNRRQDFAQLWDSINAKRGYPWKNNDPVWVVEFKRIEGPT